MTIIVPRLSTSSLLQQKTASDYAYQKHFRWDSIVKFCYLAYTFSSSSYNFDIFSMVLYECVKISEFIFFEIIIGMAYMFMDFFIKLYTRRIDCNHTLNPLLKGITFGCILQASVWLILSATDLADCIRFLLASLRRVPIWAKCQSSSVNTTCLSTREVLHRCGANNYINLNTTSIYNHYVRDFSSAYRSGMTARLFVIALVWLFNFFAASVTDTALIKVIKITSLWRVVSTVFVLIFTIINKDNIVLTAIKQIFDINDPRVCKHAIDRVTFAFGIGVVGVYDFGTVSSYTMIDTAVVIFTIVFTVFSFVRSIIIRVLYLSMIECIKIEMVINWHCLLFVIVPLSGEFLSGHKVFIIYVYMYVICSVIPSLAMLTLTISKLLHNEFRSIKKVYMIGLLCFFGCNISLLLATLPGPKIQEILQGISITMLYLGAFKVAVIMWLYGVDKFSTDIQFSVGFKPTKFWTVSWVLMPVFLFTIFVHKSVILIQSPQNDDISAMVWLASSILIVTIIQIRTVVSYIIRNNLVGVFKSSKKYGPPDTFERMRRRRFDVSILDKECRHDCILIDEKLDCNHLPLTCKGNTMLDKSSDASLTNIYEAGLSMPKISSTIYAHND